MHAVLSAVRRDKITGVSKIELLCTRSFALVRVTHNLIFHASLGWIDKLVIGLNGMGLEIPYYAVIFTSKLKDLPSEKRAHYDNVGDKMVALAAVQPGFLGVDSVRDAERTGITVSYWKDLESIRNWKRNSEHTIARNQRDAFYLYYNTRIALVEREYEFSLIQ